MMIVGALIILVRPINGIALLFPLLYLVDEKNRLSERLRWPRRFPLATACGSVAALLLWLPQLLYWRSITGELFIFSYGRKGEHFEWSHPHLLDILLNVRNGWFIYTPIMLPVIIALMCMAWKRIEGARTILIIWSLAWMTYACWWSWWLGGAFGFRGFIEYYAFLAVPLAWIVQRVLEQRWPTRLSALLICAALVIINIRMTVMFDWAWSSSEWTWTDLRGTWARIF